jgi:integrase
MTTELTTAKRKAKKRANREGTLYFDAKRKLWIGEVMVGYRPDGKADVRRTTARRQDDCKAKLDGIKAQAAGGLLPGADRRGETLATLLDAWLTSVQSDLRINTYRRYEQYARFHFKPALGTVKLSDLKPARIQESLAAKRTAPRDRVMGKSENAARPLTARTVRHMYVVLNTALRWGVRKGLLTLNPCDRVDPPRVERLEVKPLTAEDTGKLLATATGRGDRLRALWELGALTGARKGELLALRWTDIDLEAGTLNISRTQVEARGGQGTYNPTKTQRSRRVLDLAPDVVDALRAHQDRQKWDRQALGEDYTDNDLVFATGTGTPLSHSNTTRAFKSALKAAGLPTETRFHHLRHGAATMMLAAGEDVPTVSEYLGHSSAAVTMGIYAHVIPGAKKRAASKLADAIRNARSG